MSEHDREEWIAARRLLDESAAALDAATLSRLNRARQAALGQRRRPRFAPTGWLPAAGLAAACALLLAVAAWNPLQHAGSLPAPSAPSAVVDADAGSADDIEFYQNLDFYAWLDAEQDGDG